MFDYNVYILEITDGYATITFVCSTTNLNSFYINRMIMTPSVKQMISRTDTTARDISSTTTSGVRFRIYYR